jgi:hypothetical protein
MKKYKINYKNFGSSLVDKLKKLYPVNIHDKSFEDNYDNYDTTYGEMTYDGIETFFDTFTNVNHFLDIGSGRGKICLYASHLPHIESSLGIEVVKERHRDAVKLQQKLKSFFEINKVTFINDDLFNVELPKNKYLIWISNLCMDQELTDKIFTKLINELPKGTIVTCSKETNKLKFIKKINIPMSWNEESEIYVYIF